MLTLARFRTRQLLAVNANVSISSVVFRDEATLNFKLSGSAELEGFFFITLVVQVVVGGGACVEPCDWLEESGN